MPCRKFSGLLGGFRGFLCCLAGVLCGGLDTACPCRLCILLFDLLFLPVAGKRIRRGNLRVIMQEFLILKFHICPCCRFFSLCRRPVGFQLVAVVALPDFPCPVPCAALGQFLGLVCALHAGVVFFHFMYLVVDEYTRFLHRTGQRIFSVLQVRHGLFPFFKVQSGLAFSCGFVKGAVSHKHFFLWDCRPCRVQTVSGFVGVLDTLFKLRGGKFLVGKLQS